MLRILEELSQFNLEPRAIEMVPASVARELVVLPLLYRNSILELVLPAEVGFEADDTVERLRFVLECEFTYRFAVTKDLRLLVDLFYTAVYSEITNCGSEMKIRCPKRWAELDPTENVRVRNCGVCNQMVTYCTDSNELEQLAS